MAIRYSGDVEIRVQYRAGKYHAKLRAPGLRADGVLPGSLRARMHGPSSPEAYDVMALAFLRLAQREGFPVMKERGQVVLRRTFQAPCPYRS